jgi:hypothetical protein
MSGVVKARHIKRNPSVSRAGVILRFRARTPASRISDYETGQRTISKEVAKKFAVIFNVSPAMFI